ncbi:MAG: response regulator [Elusimicrobiales bacterium]|nr:response regulator [Elusimicrobiales bacterium]HOJ86042.1 response regulator [Elusimicrobiales bacterium]HOL62249.1 response regulator [Elusimicrobiales bacterium]HPO95427.1 response regulator [Elusimicrobiales bacterium]
MSNKILILDDDLNFVDTLKDSIKEKIGESEILVFSKVKQAVAYLSENLADIIISDVSLEDMNGMEFLKIIKTSDKLKDIPVIMMSAKYIEPIDRVNALKSGAAAYYSKPFDVGKLCDEIKYYVQKKRK